MKRHNRTTRGSPTGNTAPPHFQVTAALIHGAGDRFLIARRPPGGAHGGLWELPGGKQEPGETLEQCLAREIREELSLEIEVGERLAAVDQVYGEFSITLHVFSCSLTCGTAAPGEDECIRWITGADLRRFDFPAADRQAFGLLEKRLASGRFRAGRFNENRR